MSRRHSETGTKSERTREAILAAAVAEFGAKGYSGARTAGIAERAGVNQQLIAYYFGGKQGLLDELRRRWTEQQEGLAPADTTFAAALRTYLDATLDNPDWARLVIWRGLGDRPGDGADESDERQRQRLAQGIERLRSRQDDGEVTDAVSAEFVMLLAHLVTFAPIAMPQMVRDIIGTEPGSTEYREFVSRQLGVLLDPR